MKAVAYDGAGSVRILDVKKPVVEDPKDAIVQITHATICGSDLNILNGKLDLTSIISHKMPLEKAGEAYGLAVSRTGNAIKIILCGYP